MLFTPDDRERLRSALLAEIGADARITGAAMTGSASLGKEDRWSDIDLAFGIASDLAGVLQDCTARMYAVHGALHHVDVLRESTTYRVFLLANTLQVDLAFAPAADFRARAPSFKLVKGTAAPADHRPPPTAEFLIGMAWLYALHARSSIARGRFWQAEYMISGVRDHVLALACLRHGLPTAEGRGFDQLPDRDTFRGALVQSLERDELQRAFRFAMEALLRESERADADLTSRLRAALIEIAA